ncbi:MAG: hypothetical protein HY369_02130 [Candidatus Aenigmarchaeota archaeon]|nr:hypothetical protein [Candidatus Aenigmarchaeota archaeon]
MSLLGPSVIDQLMGPSLGRQLLGSSVTERLMAGLDAARDPFVRTGYDPGPTMRRQPGSSVWLHDPDTVTAYGRPEPTAHERLLRAEERWEASRREAGVAMVGSGMGPQSAWEEQALHYTERVTGLRFPLPVPPASYSGAAYQEPAARGFLSPAGPPEGRSAPDLLVDQAVSVPLLPDPTRVPQSSGPSPVTLPNLLPPIDITDPALFPQPYRRHDAVRYPGNDLWLRTLKDGTELIGEIGLGTHTHFGTSSRTGHFFAQVKDETTGKHYKDLGWT